MWPRNRGRVTLRRRFLVEQIPFQAWHRFCSWFGQPPNGNCREA